MDDSLGLKLTTDRWFTFNTLRYVFAFLDHSDIFSAMNVCTLWREVCNEIMSGINFWQRLILCSHHLKKLGPQYGERIQNIFFSKECVDISEADLNHIKNLTTKYFKISVTDMNVLSQFLKLLCKTCLNIKITAVHLFFGEFCDWQSAYFGNRPYSLRLILLLFPSVKEISIEITDVFQLPENLLALKKSNISSLKISTSDFDDEEIMEWRGWKQLGNIKNIRNLWLDFDPYYEEVSYAGLQIGLSKSKHLEKLRIVIGKGGLCLLKIISKLTKLHTLVLEVRERDIEGLDQEIMLLKNIKNLHILTYQDEHYERFYDKKFVPSDFAKLNTAILKGVFSIKDTLRSFSLSCEWNSENILIDMDFEISPVFKYTEKDGFKVMKLNDFKKFLSQESNHVKVSVIVVAALPDCLIYRTFCPLSEDAV